MIEFVLAFLVGIFLGTITGITPGVHINFVAALILLLALTSPLQPLLFVVFITSMAITHTFIDFIPSIYLSAPDEDTGLSILPGHRFLLKGYGHHAVRLTLIGSTISIALLTLIIPLFILLIPLTYPFISRMMAFFLIWIVILLIYSEPEGKFRSLTLFLLSGSLGLSALNMNINQPLLPILTGLFGASALLMSIKLQTEIPRQEIQNIKITKEELIKPSIITFFISPIASLFPGLGSSQAAVIGSRVGGKLNREQFLVLLGSINTLVIAVSFLTLFLIQKTRTGASVAINQIMQVGSLELTLIITTIFLTTLIAYPLTINISKIFAKNIHRVSYSKLSLIIISLLSIFVIIISGFLGFVVFIVSTILGITAIELGVRRSFLMGCLLIPTIIFYLPFS